MFLVLDKETGEHDFSLKPMNCPSHHLYFGTRKHSYRELPLGFATYDVLHRNEVSGALGGLTRVRQFQQDDCHIYLMGSQIAAEVRRIADMILELLRDVRAHGHAQVRHPARAADRRRRDVGPRRGRPPRGARGDRASRTSSSRATARSTAPRSTSTSPTRSGASGSSARSSSTTPRPSGSTSSTWARTTPSTGRWSSTAPWRARSSASWRS